jgi:hypothetical protein
MMTLGVSDRERSCQYQDRDQIENDMSGMVAGLKRISVRQLWLVEIEAILSEI